MSDLQIRNDFRKDGYREFGLYNERNVLVACIWRPVPKGKWFLSLSGKWGKKRFPTMKAAIAAANEHRP